MGSDEEIPPPVIERIISTCTHFYEAAPSLRFLGYGETHAPGKMGRESFLYGALANEGIFDDDVMAVIEEKRRLWWEMNGRRISQRDLLLTHASVRVLVWRYAESVLLD